MHEPDLPDAATTAGATRRRFLGTLALAPLLPLAAGCATARPVAGEGAAAAGGASTAAPGDASSDPYRVLREQPLVGDPEPALEFHALAPKAARR